MEREDVPIPYEETLGENARRWIRRADAGEILCLLCHDHPVTWEPFVSTRWIRLPEGDGFFLQERDLRVVCTSEECEFDLKHGDYMTLERAQAGEISCVRCETPLTGAYYSDDGVAGVRLGCSSCGFVEH